MRILTFPSQIWAKKYALCMAKYGTHSFFLWSIAADFFAKLF